MTMTTIVRAMAGRVWNVTDRLESILHAFNLGVDSFIAELDS